MVFVRVRLPKAHASGRGLVWQDKPRQGRTRHGKGTFRFGRGDGLRLGSTPKTPRSRQGKARHGKARQGKARHGR